MNKRPFYLIVAKESVEGALNYHPNNEYLSRILSNINTVIEHVPKEDVAIVSEKTETPFALNKHAEAMIGDKYRRINVIGGFWLKGDEDFTFKVNQEVYRLKKNGYRNVNVQENATLIKEEFDTHRFS